MVWLHGMNSNMIMSPDMCSGFDMSSSQPNYCRYVGTLTNENVTFNLSSKLLLLSAEVETNPGPFELDVVLQAIQSSKGEIIE